MKTLFTILALSLSAPAYACETLRVGDIEVSNAWSRASVGTNAPGVAYLTIRNVGAVDDTLTSVSTPAANMPMLHETVVTDGVAAMPHLMAVPLAAGQTVMLQPGGMHAMLMGLTAPLKKDASFPLTLTFATAGEVTVPVEVLALGATGPDCAP